MDAVSSDDKSRAAFLAAIQERPFFVDPEEWEEVDPLEEKEQLARKRFSLASMMSVITLASILLGWMRTEPLSGFIFDELLGPILKVLATVGWPSATILAPIFLYRRLARFIAGRW
jgi:hypothetical protein